MRFPDWWVFFVLALCSYRLWKLVAEDEITAGLRRWLVGFDPADERIPYDAIQRKWVARLINCPWCLGFWIALAVWVSWQVWPHFTVVWSVPWALSAAVGWIASEHRESMDD